MRRILSFAMSLIMCFSATIGMFTNVYAADEAYYTAQRLTIINPGVEYPLLKFNGSADYENFAPKMVMWFNPDREINYAAYCVNPAYGGYGDRGEYDVDIYRYDITDDGRLVDAGGSGGSGKAPGDNAAVGGQNVRDTLEAAIRAGFPSNSARDLYGCEYSAFDGLTPQGFEYGAYLATKMAIWALIHNSYSNPASWTANSTGSSSSGTTYSAEFCQRTHELFMEIYNAGKNYTAQDPREATLTAGTPVQVDGNWEVTYTIGGFVLPEKEIYAGILGDPNDYEGLTFKYTDGSDIPKGGIKNRHAMEPGTTEFKVTVAAPTLAPGEEYSISKQITIYVENDNKVLLYADAEPEQAQNYVLCGLASSAPFAPFEIGDAKPGGGTVTADGDLNIIKLDAVTGAPLAGVTFDVYNSKGQKIATGTTNSGGCFSPDIRDDEGKLMLDTYWITERTTNPGYQYTEPLTQSILIDRQDATYDVTFRDFPSKTVTIYKEDAQTGEPVNGCQYEIMQIDGKGAWRAVEVTSGKGMAKWDNVPDGTYLVREVSTIDGYILDATPQYVTVRNGQAPSLKFLDSKFPGLSIMKMDKLTGSVIANQATFHVEQIDGAYTADINTSSGVAALTNLPVGSYKITELSAPEGYVATTDYETVYLGEGESKQVMFYNLPCPLLSIEKIDAQTGDPIPGTMFEIKKTDGTLIGTVETGSDGTVVVGRGGTENPIGYLEPGIYTATEVYVPEPYVLSGEHQDITLNAGDRKTLFFGNLEMPQILIEKYDEQTTEKLPNAQFAIYEQHDMARPVVEGVTGADGTLNSGFIPPGTYVIQELNPPPGYMFSDKTETTRTIVAKAGDGVIKVKFDNIRLPQLTIKKVDAITGEPIAGVTYRVELTDDVSAQPATHITNAQGLIVIPGLAAGTYTITEISCPSRYILNSTPQQVKMEGGDEKTVLFENTLYPTLVIEKIDYTTFKPVANTTFKVERENTTGGIELIGSYRTDENGRIVLPYVNPGWYVLTETIPAQGMSLPSNPVTRIYLAPGTNSYTDTSGGNIGGNGEFAVTSGLDYPVVAGVPNYPLNSIVIKKTDAVTGELLAGAHFELIKVTGEMSGQNGQTLGTFITDASGVLVITGLEAGGYAVRETKAPPNYTLSENSLQNGFLKADGTSILEFNFSNLPFGSLIVTKVNAKTSAPLANARFKVTDSDGAVVGNDNGIYTTESNGEFVIPNLTPGSYVVTELEAPEGYAIDPTPQTITIDASGKIYKLTFRNEPLGTLIILKKDSRTLAPLQNAQFKVTASTGEVAGTGNGIFTTDNNGSIKIPNLNKGAYVVEEIKAPDNYILENQTKTIEIDYGNTYTLEFVNRAKSGLQIVKIDAATKEPLKDAKFRVYKQNGEVVGDYVTDGNGIIILDTLDPGWYKILETKAPNGYLADETPKDVEVTSNQFIKVTFENKKLTSLIIKKIDEKSGAPLAGAKFYVEKQNGLHVGEYSTDTDGLINLPTLDPDWYVVRETKSPDGYILDETPKTVEVKTDVPTVVTFTNKPMSGLKILKLDSVTREPLKGVEFAVAKMNGERIGNFKTDDIGQIYVDNLEDGYYTVTEIKGIDGYLMDKEPKTVQIQWGKPTVLEVTNDPYPALVIKKISSEDKKPIAGVKFLVTKLNGEQIGNYTTDRAGMIVIEGLEEGKYLVRETEAANGFKLDETAHEVDIKYGKRVTLEVKNEPMSSILIQKIDSVTRKGIYGVKFLLYDGKDNPLGQFISDDQGYVWLDKELPAGKYKLRELEPAAGYLRDDVPRTIYLGEGQTTHVLWENTPQVGQIMVTKRSSSFNELTGLPAGSPLPGAVFEVYNTAGNVVDKMTSDTRGVAASKPLPIGMYFIKEVSAPRYYALNAKELWAEIKHNGDIVRFEVFNESASLALTIQKKGPNQAAPGQTIRYDLYEIANNSSVALENFYIHDRIPSDATRAKTLVTGTYNERMYYKVTFKTNQRDYRVLAENLLTKNSYEYSLHPNALGLAAGEYVTDIRLEFPKASPGFKSVENMVLFCEVMPTIPKDYNIVNRADLGGRYGNEWESAKTSWNTKVWAQNAPAVPLPKTGY